MQQSNHKYDAKFVGMTKHPRTLKDIMSFRAIKQRECQPKYQNWYPRENYGTPV